MPTIVLVRPGCTDFNEQNRVQGSLDLPLNRRGEDQVQVIIDELRQFSLDIIYTAPCEPARSTARAIGTALNIPVKESKGLKNLDQGLWQGLPLEEIRRKFPKVCKQWQEAPETICPPEGETISHAIERIKKVLPKLLKRKPPIAVVASDPVASLVSCVIKGGKLKFSELACRCHENRLVEIIETNGKFPADPTQPNETVKQVASAKSST